MRKIVIFGGGLAGHMTAMALSKRLPETIDITYIKTKGSGNTDIFYGNVSPPSTYDFLLSLGISEPKLLLGTNTSFSLGTRYKNWGSKNRSWTQTYHQPLPIHHGVKFHHYVSRHLNGADELTLDPYIMSVEAANKGVFAHPPEGKNIPLAAVEYGYHFAPIEWSAFLESQLDNLPIKKVDGAVEALIQNKNAIQAIQLKSGQIIEADLFIDCTGQDGEDTDQEWNGRRALRVVSHDHPQEALRSVVRTLEQTDYGWQSETPLRGRVSNLHICDPRDETAFKKFTELNDSVTTDIKLGRSASPWQGNILKLGHSAGVLDPITPAPIKLLQHDIERLLELIPITTEMTVEAREYNRRFVQDFDNAAIFNCALFSQDEKENSSYHKAVTAAPIPNKLQTKIVQFQSRGICVQYDNELFNEQDWILLHLGMGRTPARYDPLTDRVSEPQITQMLENINRAVTQMATKMPPHQKYISGLLKFLKEKHG